MKKRWITAAAVIGVCALGLTGCNKEGAEETAQVQQEDLAAIEEAQNKIIAEYAAGVLMKYNAGTNSRVLEGQKLLVEEKKEDAKKLQEEKRQQLFEEYEKEKTKSDEASSQEDSNSAVSGGEVSKVAYINDMAAAMENSSFSITYSGYEITNSYKEDDGIISFSVDAKEGKMLIVSKFLVTNTGAQEEELNLLAAAPEFKAKLSGKVVKAEQTMLLNDLSMYKEVLKSAETKEAVILFEVPQETTVQLGNMELIVKINDKESRMLLESGQAPQPQIETEATSEVSQDSEEAEIRQEDSQEAEEETATELEEVIITTVGSNNNVIVEPTE